MTAVLDVQGLGKRFGAHRALHGVGFEVHAGETFGLIGPNGAGKTTLFDLVTGFLRPDAGRVRLAGAPIDRLSVAARARRGLVRTFQKPTSFPALSLRENVALAARRRAGAGLAWIGAGHRLDAAMARADALIAAAALASRAERLVADLSHGEQRIADVLVSLALEPRLLLLDEPTAGLAPEESARLLDLVQARPGTATVLIAHDLDVVFGRCHRIAVLGAGELLCCGTPDAVRADPSVRAAYLGALAGA